MKRVFITGAAGAIGIHLVVHILKNTDWKLVLTDSFRHKGYYDRLSTIYKDNSDAKERIEIIQHDLLAPFTDREINLLGRIDYIVNLASLSDVQASIDDPVPFIRNNSEIMLTVLELARKVKPSTFLHFSTDEVYGSAKKDSPGHKEWDKILPSNPYSASKAAQEAYAIAYWRSYGVPLVITNTMNNFGETQSPSKFPAMIQQKVERGEIVDIHCSPTGEIGTRYYLHSRNASDATLFILENLPPKLHQTGEVDEPDRYNIVGDKQVSNLELAQLIANLMGKELKYRLVSFHEKNPGHDAHYGLNGNKLSRLGWRPPLSFEDSLAKTIKWQKENPSWME